MPAAITQVTLAKTTSPSSGQPLSGYISVSGTGFPGGTILPSAVAVTLTSPSGSAVKTAASQVTVMSGSSESISFRIPAALAVTTPTVYAVSIAGKTESGSQFQSSNTSSLTIDPAAELLSISPTSGLAGSSFSVLITGDYTHFVQGTTTASFGPGIAVGGGALGQAGPVSVTSSTSATAQIAISSTATAGAQTVLVVTGGEQESLVNAFTVLTSPQLISVAPNSGYPGTVFSVVLTGANTHFSQGSTYANFGTGISVAGNPFGQPGLVTVTSPTSGTVQVGISVSAAAGPQAVKVTTGTEHLSLANGFTVVLPPKLISAVPNTGAAGTSLSVVLTGANTHFVQGTTTASFGPGIAVGGGTSGQPGPVTVTSSTVATAQINISSTATVGTQTVQVATGTEQESLINGFTVMPAPQLLSVSPNTLNAGLATTVTLTGLNTHFVQGQTQASFGAGIAVGGGTEGQPGPVTVTSATTATAQIVVDPAAAAGVQTVTVITGTETESLASGFTVGTPVGVINITTTSSLPLAPGFSGVQDEFDLNGVEYYDPKYLAMVEPMKIGCVRYPGGLPSMVFDWQTGKANQTWIAQLSPEVFPYAANGFTDSQYLLQGKGGANFNDYSTFVKTLGATGVVDVNGWTDNLPNSYGQLVNAAQANGVNIIEWEMDNEPYFYPAVFPTAAAYAASAQNPYAANVLAANPDATVGVFYQGQYSSTESGTTWDNGMAAFSPKFWQGVSTHIYPIGDSKISAVNEEQTLNGFLAHGTNEYFANYFIPLVGANTPIFITEWNTDGISTLPFESYEYNAVVVAEYIARVATVPNIKEVGVTELYLGNNFNQGMIRAVDDFESFLIAQVQANPNYSTNTATNPKTQFQFYYSTSALGLIVLNQAVNSSNATWPTTVSATGIPTVPIQGFDGLPIPAVFAQAFAGTDGTHYLVITNKSGSSVPVGVEVNGLLGPSSVTASYISTTSDTAQNTATNQTAVSIVNTTFQNPLTVGPYSVTRLQW